MASLHPRIVTDPAICGGRPVIRGTRMRVADILALLGEGVPRDVILADYDYIADEDITASLVYAADVLDHHAARAA